MGYDNSLFSNPERIERGSMWNQLPSRDESNPGTQSMRRRRSYVTRQLAQLLTSILVLALVGGGLVMVFRGGSEASRRAGDASFLAAGASPIATSAPQTPDLQSRVFESDNGAAQAYFAHLGVWPNIVEQVAGATVSVAWAYADTNRAIILYTIAGQTDAQGNPVPPPLGPGCSVRVTLTTAPARHRCKWAGTRWTRAGRPRNASSCKISPTLVQ